MLSLTFGEVANIPHLHAESCFLSLHIQILSMKHSCKKSQRVLRHGSILYTAFKWVFKK